MANSSTASAGHRVLVCAPYGRDGESIVQLLCATGYDTAYCADLAAVASLVDEHVGVILLTQEALVANVHLLKRALASQPSWSDVPFILLAATRSNRQASTEASRAAMFDLAIHNIVLERPLGKASLVSAVASAMRSRQRQFEMRDRLSDLAESENRLRLATSAANIGTWDYDPVAGTLRWDARCKEMFGLPPDAEVTYAGTFLRGLHPNDREAVETAVSRALEPGGSGEYNIEFRTVGARDGIERWVAAIGRSVFEGGRPVRFIGTIIDISERKATSAALDQLNRTLEQQVAERTAALQAEMASRSRAEAALHQSQKMEAVGQLTGGIAHDFNNMLTGVIGGLNIIKRRLASGRIDDLERFVDSAAAAANRAASLIARLLAFSRRQSLDSKPLDINALTLSMEDLLRRSLSERISLRIVPGADVGRAIVDANQLESALLNLAINARDAMPDGGQLTVETALIDLDEAYAAAKPEVAPGRYVVIAVSDTGVGISPELMDKVFDPFFTTKPIGQGTGLGLSMVYGFARQSGGQVRIHSRPGEGTSVKLYLPASDGAVAEPPASRGSAPREGDGQTVLLVEDDESVRILVREVLAELSYQAIEAADADGAIPILCSGRKIDLMVSDVGLPGLSGRQLAEIARQQAVEVARVGQEKAVQAASIAREQELQRASVERDQAVALAGFLGTNMDMITKPFALDVLAAKIDEMIL